MTTPDEPDLVAAELALGVLDGEQRAAALRRVIADPEFARDVARWRRHFAALYAEIAPVEPGNSLDRLVPTITDNDARPVRTWRAVAAIAGMAAAILLAVVLARPAPRPVPSAPGRSAPLLVAVLTPKDAQPVAAVFDPGTRALRLHGALTVASDREAELWAIGGDGIPHAAGLLTRRRGAPLTIAPRVAIAAGITLAISIEPVGGSPRPTPTGPVVATGQLAAI